MKGSGADKGRKGVVAGGKKMVKGGQKTPDMVESQLNKIEQQQVSG